MNQVLSSLTTKIITLLCHSLQHSRDALLYFPENSLRWCRLQLRPRPFLPRVPGGATAVHVQRQHEFSRDVSVGNGAAISVWRKDERLWRLCQFSTVLGSWSAVIWAASHGGRKWWLNGTLNPVSQFTTASHCCKLHLSDCPRCQHQKQDIADKKSGHTQNAH